MVLSPLHPCTYCVSRAAEIPGIEQSRCEKSQELLSKQRAHWFRLGMEELEVWNCGFGRQLGRQNLVE